MAWFRHRHLPCFRREGQQECLLAPPRPGVLGGAGFLLPGATPQGKAALGAKGGETRLGQFQSPTYRPTAPSSGFPQYPEPQRGATGWCPGEEGEWTLTGSGPDQPLYSSRLSPGMSPFGSQSAAPSLGFCGCQMWKTTVVEKRHMSGQEGKQAVSARPGGLFLRGELDSV